MNRLIKRLDIFAQEPQPRTAENHAQKVPDSTHHHNHERLDNVFLPDIGIEFVVERDDDASQTGQAGAERESEAVDAAGTDAKR